MHFIHSQNPKINAPNHALHACLFNRICGSASMVPLENRILTFDRMNSFLIGPLYIYIYFLFLLLMLFYLKISVLIIKYQPYESLNFPYDYLF